MLSLTRRFFARLSGGCTNWSSPLAEYRVVPFTSVNCNKCNINVYKEFQCINMCFDNRIAQYFYHLKMFVHLKQITYVHLHLRSFSPEIKYVKIN